MFGFWRLLFPEHWEIFEHRVIVGSEATPSYSVFILWALLAGLVWGATHLFGMLSLWPISFIYPILYWIYGCNASIKFDPSSSLDGPENGSLSLAIFVIFPVCLATILFTQKLIVDVENRDRTLIQLKYLFIFFGSLSIISIFRPSFIYDGRLQSPSDDFFSESQTSAGWIIIFFIVVSILLERHLLSQMPLIIGALAYSFWEISVFTPARSHHNIVTDLIEFLIPLLFGLPIVLILRIIFHIRIRVKSRRRKKMYGGYEVKAAKNPRRA